MSVEAMHDQEAQPRAFARATGSAPLSCADCKQPMAKTLAGWVHVATGLPRCDRASIVPKMLRARARWPHIEKDPQAIEHLTDIIGRLHTPMMEHTRAAVLNCLKDLRRRVLEEQNTEARDAKRSL